MGGAPRATRSRQAGPRQLEKRHPPIKVATARRTLLRHTAALGGSGARVIAAAARRRFGRQGCTLGTLVGVVGVVAAPPDDPHKRGRVAAGGAATATATAIGVLGTPRVVVVVVVRGVAVGVIGRRRRRRRHAALAAVGPRADAPARRVLHVRVATPRDGQRRRGAPIARVRGNVGGQPRPPAPARPPLVEQPRCVARSLTGWQQWRSRPAAAGV